MSQTPKILAAPDGRETKFITFDAKQPIVVAVPVPAHLCTGDEPEVVNVSAPTGAGYLYSATRQCGDWYAQFDVGMKRRNAIGATQADAIRNAADRFAA
jgi:hypothetical protein